MRNIPIIDINRVSVKGFYINKVFEWKSYKHSEQLDRSKRDIKNVNRKEAIKKLTSVQNDKEHQILNNLRTNRTIFFNCSVPVDNIGCTNVQLSIFNFRPGSEPISMTLNFPLDLSKVGKLTLY